MTPVDLAWQAGILEGEGSIRIAPHTGPNRGYLCVDIPNGLPEITAAFHEAWGGRRYYRDPGPPRRPFWRWRACSRDALACLVALQPYLRTSAYQARAALALEYQAQKSLAGRWIEGYGDRQQEFYRRMAVLNKRGC